MTKRTGLVCPKCRQLVVVIDPVNPVRVEFEQVGRDDERELPGDEEAEQRLGPATGRPGSVERSRLDEGRSHGKA